MQKGDRVKITEDLRREQDKNNDTFWPRSIVGYKVIYEGEYPWCVQLFDGKWTKELIEYGEYISNEAVTIDDIPIRDLFPLPSKPIVIKPDTPIAFIIFRGRFRIVGKRERLWEHEIKYELI